jgi:hypothetical protein
VHEPPSYGGCTHDALFNSGEVPTDTGTGTFADRSAPAWPYTCTFIFPHDTLAGNVIRFDGILPRDNGFIALLDITRAKNYIRDA